MVLKIGIHSKCERSWFGNSELMSMCPNNFPIVHFSKELGIFGDTRRSEICAHSESLQAAVRHPRPATAGHSIGGKAATVETTAVVQADGEAASLPVVREGLSARRATQAPSVPHVPETEAVHRARGHGVAGGGVRANTAATSGAQDDDSHHQGTHTHGILLE